MFEQVKKAIEDIRQGKMVLVLDDPDRENEGDLVCAAEFAAPEVINFMASAAKGLICMPMSRERTQKLRLPQMVERNTDSHSTAFTVSIDHIETTTGISAFERSLTARKCACGDARPEDFRRPGHLFPLEAKPGGVLERAGHTEASVDLARLAGLNEVAVCCEIMDDDGTMMRTTKLRVFAEKHRLNVVSVAELIEYRKAGGR